MNVLLVGSGAREHALAWKLRQSPRLTDLWIAPGNAGTRLLGENINVPASDIEGLVSTAKERRAELVIVGPEDPLARGLVDRLAVEGIPAFGPTKAAAAIESSKAFSKDLMLRHDIPTADARTFSRKVDALDYIESLAGGQLVVKADGLAAGKGVFVCDSREEALTAVEQMMGDAAIFGASGSTVVIEERLRGREVSAMAFTDGVTVAPMPFSCDYKRVGDGDDGPNTGGLGAYSPATWLEESQEVFIHERITEAAIAAMRKDGAPYRGVLYPGCMVTDEGPKTIEFNCRFGDPETQVLLPRLKSDLLEICLAVAHNRLSDAEIEWSTDAAVCVVMASGGYPGDYATGYPIAGLDSVEDGVVAFHAGTRVDEDGRVVTAGGRVLAVTATGKTLSEARATVYRNVQRIHFTQAYYRRDIAAPSQNARVD
jgi:phosphoribosylamine--glycine ligase